MHNINDDNKVNSGGKKEFTALISVHLISVKELAT